MPATIPGSRVWVVDQADLAPALRELLPREPAGTGIGVLCFRFQDWLGVVGKTS